MYKVAEEAAEVLLASKNGTEAEIVYEMADLCFHALVLLGHHTIHPHEVLCELQRRWPARWRSRSKQHLRQPEVVRFRHMQLPY